MSLERTEYYRSELLNLRYVRCRSAEKGMSDVENSDADTLVFPLRGVFVEHFSPRRHILAEPNLALIFPRGTASRVSHPVCVEDDCLAVDYSSECFQEIARSSRFTAAGAHALLSPSIMAARNLFCHRIARNAASELEIEETAVALLAYCAGFSPGHSLSSEPNSRMCRMIETARVVLLSHPEKPWNLSGLAKALECSPFHLTRMFRKYVGVPLHRYQLHTRLGRAFDLLLETDRDLTNIALELGFNSHSHFTAAFRRWIGFTPKQIREASRSQRFQARRIVETLLSVARTKPVKQR